jgi:uncharacterized protein YoaH (UPF0181 family)
MKPKDPPGYPGDEAINEAIVKNVRRIRIAKRLSIEQADAFVAAAIRKDTPSNTPRAIGLVVQELREKRQMSRRALSRASGLSLCFIVRLERWKADPLITDVARLSLGLGYPITDLVERVPVVKQRLDSNESCLREED